MDNPYSEYEKRRAAADEAPITDQEKEAFEEMGKALENVATTGRDAYRSLMREGAAQSAATEDQLDDMRSYTAQNRGDRIYPVDTIMMNPPRWPGKIEKITKADADAIQHGYYCGFCLSAQKHPGQSEQCDYVHPMGDRCEAILEDWKPRGQYGRIGLHIIRQK